MDLATIAVILSAVFMVGAGVAGTYLVKAKGVIKRLITFLEATEQAIDDNKLTEAEVKDLIAKAIAIVKGDETEEK